MPAVDGGLSKVSTRRAKAQIPLVPLMPAHPHHYECALWTIATIAGGSIVHSRSLTGRLSRLRSYGHRLSGPDEHQFQFLNTGKVDFLFSNTSRITVRTND